MLFSKSLLKSKMNCFKSWANKPSISPLLLHWQDFVSLSIFLLEMLPLFFITWIAKETNRICRRADSPFFPGLLFYLMLTCCIALYHWFLDSPAPVLSHTPFRSETHHCICSIWALPPACLLTYSCAEALMHTHLTELSSKQDPLATTWAGSLPW